MADKGQGGRVSRMLASVSSWAGDAWSRPWATFLVAVVLVVCCVATLVWFVSFSGLNAPAGFVYSQF